MDCNQTSKLLNAYVDKELSKSDQTLLESHIAECPNCRAELEDIRRLDAQVHAEVSAPAELRSKIADRLEAARTVSPRVSLKEMLGMRYRIGLAAVITAGLIVVGILSTGGNAQAALARMRKAITHVTSSHLHIEINAPMDFDNGDMSQALGGGNSSDKADGSNAMAAMAIGAMVGGGNKDIDVWSQGSKWKAQVFGKINAIYNDGYVTLVLGDKVMAKVKADKSDFPTDMSDFLFKNLSKATEEMKQKCNVRNVGSVQEGGRTLDTLEVTGLEDNGKNFRLMYWVDEATNLPARFQVFAKQEGSSDQKLVCTITCDYNETYPDSMFDPGADKP